MYPKNDEPKRIQEKTKPSRKPNTPSTRSRKKRPRKTSMENIPRMAKTQNNLQTSQKTTTKTNKPKTMKGGCRTIHFLIPLNKVLGRKQTEPLPNTLGKPIVEERGGDPPFMIAV